MKKTLATFIAATLIGMVTGAQAERGDRGSEAADQAKDSVKKRFPPHWGKPPDIQTKDFRPLPGGFGHGSSTLAHWIEVNMKADHERGKGKGDKGDGGKGDGGKGDGKGDRPKPPRPFEPKHPPRPEPNAELKGKLDAYKVAQDALRDALKAKIDQELGEDATRDEIKAVADAFKADNKDAIEAQIAAAKDIHEAMKANRPEREKIDRPEPPAEVKAAAGVVRAKHKDLVKARLDLHKDLKDATDEEKKEKIAAFKDSQRDQHKDLKDAKKALREAIRDNAQKETGSRRGED